MLKKLLNWLGSDHQHSTSDERRNSYEQVKSFHGLAIQVTRYDKGLNRVLVLNTLQICTQAVMILINDDCA